MQKCHICDIGKVSENQNATACSDCDAGQSSDSEGSAKCTSCGAGQYSNVAGADCKNCPHGQFRPSGDDDPERCLPCKPGKTTQSNGSGAIACDTCDLGMY